MTRFVEIPGDASFRSEDGDLSRTYIVTAPGRGEIRIEVARDAIVGFEDCVVGRVGGFSGDVLDPVGDA